MTKMMYETGPESHFFLISHMLFFTFYSLATFSAKPLMKKSQPLEQQNRTVIHETDYS